MSLTKVALEVVDTEEEGKREEAVTLLGVAVVVAREVALAPRAVFVAARLPNLTFFAVVASRSATR